MSQTSSSRYSCDGKPGYRSEVADLVRDQLGRVFGTGSTYILLKKSYFPTSLKEYLVQNPSREKNGTKEHYHNRMRESPRTSQGAGVGKKGLSL